MLLGLGGALQQGTRTGSSDGASSASSASRPPMSPVSGSAPQGHWADLSDRITGECSSSRSGTPLLSSLLRESVLPNSSFRAFPASPESGAITVGAVIQLSRSCARFLAPRVARAVCFWGCWAGRPCLAKSFLIWADRTMASSDSFWRKGSP